MCGSDGRDDPFTRVPEGNGSSRSEASVMLPQQQVEVMLQGATLPRQGARGVASGSGLPWECNEWAERLLNQQQVQRQQQQQQQQQQPNSFSLENRAPGPHLQQQQFLQPQVGWQRGAVSLSSSPLTSQPWDGSADLPSGSRSECRPDFDVQLQPSRRKRRGTASPHGYSSDRVTDAATANHWMGSNHLPPRTGDEEVRAERGNVEGGIVLASIADASERHRHRMMAWLTEMAASQAPESLDASSVDALTDAILRVSAPPQSNSPSSASVPARAFRPSDILEGAVMGSVPLGALLRVDSSLPLSQAASLPARAQQAPAAVAPPFPSLTPPPTASPRDLPFSEEVLSSMGTAVRPLAMREVRALTLALVEAIMDGGAVSAVSGEHE